MKHRLTPALVLVAALGTFGACSDDSDESDFPIGKHIPADATSTDEGYIEYKSDGTYIGIDGDGDMFTQGTYTVDGDEITFANDEFCEANAPGSNPVTYTFEWDGEILRFGDNPDDTCTPRAMTYAVDIKLASD